MNRSPYLLFFSSLVVFFSIFFLVHHQIFTDHYQSDTQEHLIFMYSFLGDHGMLTYPLWHLSGLYLSKLFSIPFQYGAILASALLVTLWFILLFLFARSHLKYRSRGIPLLTAWIVFLIGPLCIPWYNHIIFMGQGSPSVWHNVTLWAVKPFALLSVWLIVEGLRDANKILLVWGVVTTVISIFAKPSFIIMFLPALALYGLVKHLHRQRLFIIFFALVSILSVIILLYQYTHTFTQGEGKIIIDFLGVWSASSHNITVSIGLALAFPLALTLLKLDILEDDYMLIGWIMTFIGIFYYATFAQSGRFYSHGNFAWSYMIAMSLLYLFSIVKFFGIYPTLHPFKRYFLVLLLGTQTLIGIYYFIHVLIGQHPLYIGIFL